MSILKRLRALFAKESKIDNGPPPGYAEVPQEVLDAMVRSRECDPSETELKRRGYREVRVGQDHQGLPVLENIR
jgi:hypothetical protein